MCGLVGFIDFTKKSSRENLVEMCDVIRHRGPDSGNYFFHESESFNIGLGHRRLSVIDLHETANQPMFYKDYIIIFNGEVYNFKEIKTELEKLGHTFNTESDTEVILHSFEQWGNDAVGRFIGMFAFLIYDTNEKKIISVRDRPGVKPLQIYENGGIIMWASEIKSFTKHPLFSKEINLQAVKTFLQLGNIPTPHSIYKNVRKQKPGTIEVFDISTKKIDKKKYWDVTEFYKKPVLDIQFDEAKNVTKELLMSACNYRMVSDVPVGVFLSGGYDSTLVTAMLQTSMTEKLKTFTIGVHNPKINEASFAKEVANRLGTDHTEYYITENELYQLIEEIPFYYDEPFGDSSALPTMLVSQLAREKVTVALSADGGDEVFGGYNRYDKLHILKKIKNMKKLGLPLSFFADKAIKDSKNKERILDLIKNSNAYTLADQLNNPYKSGEIDQFFPTPIEALPKQDFMNDSINDDLRLFMAIDYKTYLLDDILVKVDRATMKSSLEGREPLLDHRIIEFAAQLPNQFKIRKGEKKYILREILHDYVPKEMMDRPKMGFAAPVDHWLRYNLKDKLDFYLSEAFITQQGIFNVKAVKNLLADFLANKPQYTGKIWYFLMFQMWYQKWIINEN